MNNNNNNDNKNLENEFNVLRFINKKPNTNQREIANKLGLSLGKLNYCLQQLKKKGYVKINNFKKNENKSGYLYLLTPRGIMEKTKITLAFMKRKMKEYDELKREIKDK